MLFFQYNKIYNILIMKTKKYRKNKLQQINKYNKYQIQWPNHFFKKQKKFKKVNRAYFKKK